MTTLHFHQKMSQIVESEQVVEQVVQKSAGKKELYFCPAQQSIQVNA